MLPWMFSWVKRLSRRLSAYLRKRRQRKWQNTLNGLVKNMVAAQGIVVSFRDSDHHCKSCNGTAQEGTSDIAHEPDCVWFHQPREIRRCHRIISRIAEKLGASGKQAGRQADLNGGDEFAAVHPIELDTCDQLCRIASPRRFAEATARLSY
jgi:hypothetical protein